MFVDWKHEARCALAEFFATMLFTFMGPGSVTAAVQATGGGPVEPVNYALSFGFAITVLAFAVGDVSGAHINPAVTFALFITRNITLTRTTIFIAAQILGGLAGGGLLRGAVGADKYRSGIGLSIDPA